MLFLELFLVDQADKSETLVDLAKIENDLVVASTRMIQLDNGTALFVELEGPRLLVDPVDATNVNEHVYQFGADLVMLHLHWVVVCCDVDLANDVKQECLLDFRWVYKVVDHCRYKADLREQLLDHFRERLIDSVIIDRCQVETETDLKTCVT